MVSIIVAMDKNRVIGHNNTLPWHLPEDFRHFKTTTMGCPIIMGRKTHESIGKKLPGRKNVILTRQNNYISEGCEISHSFEEAYEKAKDQNKKDQEIFVIGGSNIYESALEHVDRLYVTHVQGEFEGDTYFPEIDSKKWKVIDERTFQKDEKNKYDMKFVTYEKISITPKKLLSKHVK